MEVVKAEVPAKVAKVEVAKAEVAKVEVAKATAVMVRRYHHNHRNHRNHRNKVVRVAGLQIKRLSLNYKIVHLVKILLLLGYTLTQKLEIS